MASSSSLMEIPIDLDALFKVEVLPEIKALAEKHGFMYEDLHFIYMHSFECNLSELTEYLEKETQVTSENEDNLYEFIMVSFGMPPDVLDTIPRDIFSYENVLLRKSERLKEKEPKLPDPEFEQKPAKRPRTETAPEVVTVECFPDEVSNWNMLFTTESLLNDKVLKLQ
jgi:hypothetical protein